MYKWIKYGALSLGLLAGVPITAVAQQAAPTPGRTALPVEIRVWDIDVRPDFQGLPPGSGSVRKGQQVWDDKCASCHGVFGESNQVFTPIIGGTTKQDIANGRVAGLANNREPQRTTMMKLATVSTLWDYIRRAMPWTAPKTLSTEEVYAVTAYILNMAEVVPDDFVLSDKNIADIKLPNRNGMQQQHGLWDTKGKPDVNNSACMQNCAPQVKITSSLPAHAQGSHGDLSQQHRLIGPVRGQALALKTAATPPAVKAASSFAQLTQKHQCIACHAPKDKLVGPSWSAISARYQGQSNAAQQLLAKLKNGGAGVWGEIPMPPQSAISEQELQQMVQGVLSAAP